MTHILKTLTVFVMLLLVLTLPARVRAQCNPCVSAGVKIGHTFGPEGGFTWGLEASVSDWDWSGVMEPVLMHGVVFSFDHNTDTDAEKLHIGFEIGAVISIASTGLDLGPTIIFDRTKPTRLGFTLTPFLGAFTLHPYYSVTLGSGDAIEEAGLIGKIPIVTDPIHF